MRVELAIPNIYAYIICTYLYTLYNVITDEKEGAVESCCKENRSRYVAAMAQHASRQTEWGLQWYFGPVNLIARRKHDTMNVRKCTLTRRKKIKTKSWLRFFFSYEIYFAFNCPKFVAVSKSFQYPERNDQYCALIGNGIAQQKSDETFPGGCFSMIFFTLHGTRLWNNTLSF